MTTESNDEAIEPGEDTLAPEDVKDPVAASDEGEGETPADPAAEKADEAPKPKKTFQERMDERTRQLRETERERDAARQEAQELARKLAEKGHEVDESEIEELIEERVTAREQERQAKQAKEAFDKRMSDAAEKHDDFYEVVIEGAEQNLWPCTTDMNAAIMESDIAGEIAYHLATNPDEARRIAALTPHSQAREIGKLEAKLSAAPAPQQKPAKTLTNAPEPAPTVRGVNGQFKVASDTSDFAAFEKQYLGS